GCLHDRQEHEHREQPGEQHGDIRLPEAVIVRKGHETMHPYSTNRGTATRCTSLIFAALALLVACDRDVQPGPRRTISAVDVGISTSLTDAYGCFGGDDRLRGILFDASSGSITNNRVITIKRGLSNGCQEGNAIEIRNFSGMGVRTVLIDNNVVRDYQKNGI